MSEEERGESAEAQDVTYELKSAKEAANFLRISESTVWRYADQNILPAYRVGRKRVMFRRSDLESLLKRLRRRKEPVAATNGMNLRPMSEGTRSAADAIARATEVRERILARRGGVPVTDSWVDIADAREERTEDL